VLGIGSSAERLEKIDIEANRNDGARFVAEGFAAREHEGGVRVDLADVKARNHARHMVGGHIDPAAVIRCGTRAGDRGLGAGTALRVGTRLKRSGRGRMSRGFRIVRQGLVRHISYERVLSLADGSGVP
jgi:hypothetical protein